MHTVFALLCFVVVIHWLIFPYPSGLLYWHCGNLTIAPVPAKQPWWIWINTSCEFIMNDCVTTTKQSTTKPCEYFLGYTVCLWMGLMFFATCCGYLSNTSCLRYIGWMNKVLPLSQYHCGRLHNKERGSLLLGRKGNAFTIFYGEWILKRVRYQTSLPYTITKTYFVCRLF